jgi:hypothetical protein
MNPTTTTNTRTRERKRAGAGRPGDLEGFKDRAGGPAAYPRQFDEQYRQAVPVLAETLEREIGIVRRRASDMLDRMGARPDKPDAIREVVAAFEKDGSFADMAISAAFGASATGAADDSFRPKMDQAISAAFREGGAVAAERICRAVAFCGLGVFPAELGEYAQGAFRVLQEAGDREEACKLAIFWSNSCLAAQKGDASPTGFAPPISVDESKDAYAAWKGITRG